MAQPCVLLGIHHDIRRLPPGTSQHRAAQNYGDAGLASARTPTLQIHRDVLQQSRAVHRLQKDSLSMQHSELKGCMESRYLGQGAKY